MKYFRTDNTEGYTQETLDKMNVQFPVWAKENSFDLDDEQQYKTAIDNFHNEIMIDE